MPDKKNKDHSSAGLCTDCINASNCSLSNNHTDPVWECEEFESAVPPVKKTIIAMPENGTSMLPDAAGSRQTGQYKGLCVDCENQSSCSHEKKSEGIWHCEDYQ